MDILNDILVIRDTSHMVNLGTASDQMAYIHNPTTESDNITEEHLELLATFDIDDNKYIETHETSSDPYDKECIAHYSHDKIQHHQLTTLMDKMRDMKRFENTPFWKNQTLLK